jgi:hypothetical protein
MSRLYASSWLELGRRSPIDHCCEEFLYYIKPPADAGGQAGRFAAGHIGPLPYPTPRGFAAAASNTASASSCSK